MNHSRIMMAPQEEKEETRLQQEVVRRQHRTITTTPESPPCNHQGRPLREQPQSVNNNTKNDHTDTGIAVVSNDKQSPPIPVTPPVSLPRSNATRATPPGSAATTLGRRLAATATSLQQPATTTTGGGASKRPLSAATRKRLERKANMTKTSMPQPRRLEDSLCPATVSPEHKQTDSIMMQAVPPKRVYLIRHGESVGQQSPRHVRKVDAALKDCGLTRLGQEQAVDLPHRLGAAVMKDVDLVVCSPLTRAVLTAALAFGCNGSHEARQPPILVHYDLREIGAMIPENQPRSTKQVLDDVQAVCDGWVRRRDKQYPPVHVRDRMDALTLRPAFWPERHDTPPLVVRRHAIQKVFRWLAQERSEQTVAVVCHYHVIRAALQQAPHCRLEVHPENAVPIPCLLYADGRLEMVQEEKPDHVHDCDDDIFDRNL